MPYCFLLVNLACSSDTIVVTKENYEAILLPDGSQVYMNQYSSISYQEDFNPRTVNLSGEAFFAVKPNEFIFTVVTDHVEIAVLGTEFNVKTTQDQVAVNVKKGLVELKTEYNKSKVKKGIEAIYKNGEKEVKKIKSNQEYRKWIRSLEKDFKELGRQLNPTLKEIGKDFKKAGKNIGDEFKN